jgi:hypothetical protein
MEFPKFWYIQKYFNFNVTSLVLFLLLYINPTDSLRISLFVTAQHIWDGN